MDSRGQGLDQAAVWGIAIAILAVLVGAYVFSEVYEATSSTVEGSGVTYYDDNNIAASGMDDNGTGWTSAVSNDNMFALWDNIAQGAEDDNGLMDNSENVAGWINWYSDGVAIGDLRDATTRAMVYAKYALADNSLLENLYVAVRLERPGGDNIDIIYIDNTLFTADNHTWYTVENDVTDYINAVGTYRLHLWDNIARIGVQNENYTAIMWDNAYLVVNTYSNSFAENAIDDVGDGGSIIFSIMPIMVLVGIVLGLLFVFTKRD